MNIRNLYLEKEKKRKELEKLWAMRESRAWSKEEKDQYDKTASEAEKINADLKLRSEFIETFKMEKSKEDTAFEKNERDASLFKIIKSKIYEQTNDQTYKDDFGRVNEVLQEQRNKTKNIKDGFTPIPESAFNVKKRTDITAGTQGGDNLISEIVRPDMYVEGLYEATWMSQAGVTVLSGLEGDLRIPVINDKPSFSWIAENANFPEQDMSFEDIMLMPRYAGAIQVFSLGIFLRSQGASIVRFVQQELMRSFRSGLEKSFIQDDGTNNKPSGLYKIISDYNAGANEVSAIGGSGFGANQGGLVSYAKALETESKITSTNQMMPLRWLINDDVRLKALQVLKFPGVNGAEQLYKNGMFADRPATVTNSISKTIKKGTGNTSKIVLFQPQSLVLGRWLGGIQLQVNTQGAEYWKAGKTAVRVIDVCNLVSRRNSDFAAYEEIAA